jgi:tetratricopeptide (TPR) repeat protein
MENKNPNNPVNLAEDQELRDLEIAQKSKKIITWSVIGVIIVLAIGGLFYWLHASGESKAAEAIGAADIEMNDSVQFAMYKKIADDGSYKANERAKLMVAIKYYQDGKYKEALAYLDNVSVGSDLIQTGAYTLKGDCYANLNKLDDALKCFNEALSEADNNPQLVPFILFKEANIYRAQKNYDKELDALTTIRQQYPDYILDIDKYYERAKAAAGK